MLKLLCAGLAGIGAWFVAIWVGTNWGIGLSSAWMLWIIGAASSKRI